MRHTDAYHEFESTYSFPIDCETVIETMGEVTVESPNGPDETIADILRRAGAERFTSPRDLHDVFVGNLAEGYVGRKFYDDRGDNVGEPSTWL